MTNPVLGGDKFEDTLDTLCATPARVFGAVENFGVHDPVGGEKAAAKLLVKVVAMLPIDLQVQAARAALLGSTGYGFREPIFKSPASYSTVQPTRHPHPGRNGKTELDDRLRQ